MQFLKAPPANYDINNSKIKVTVIGRVSLKQFSESQKVIHLEDVTLLSLNGEEVFAPSESMNSSKQVNAYDEFNNSMLVSQLEKNHGKDFKSKKYGAIVYLNSEQEVENIKLGMIVKVSGMFKMFSKATNFGEFDQLEYYNLLKLDFSIFQGRIEGRGNSYWINKEMLDGFKNVLSSKFNQTLKQPYAGIMKAMLLGDKDSIDNETKSLYQKNGIIHILAISGLHISLIGLCVYKLLSKTFLSRVSVIIIVVVILGEYVIMIGASNSAIRALIMFVILMGANYIFRAYDLLSAMSIAYIIIIIFNPNAIYQSGTLLSFGAVAGIGIIYPRIEEIFMEDKKKKIKWYDYIRQAFSCSFSVLLVTMPIIVNMYNVYPLSSLFLNILVVPTMSIVLVLGIVVLIISVCNVIVASLVGNLLEIILESYEVICELIVKIPNQSIAIAEISPWRIIVYYLILSVVITMPLNKSVITDIWCKRISFTTYKYLKSCNLKLIIKIAKVCGIIIAVLVLTYNPLEKLRIIIVDVGQGDGIIIQTPDNKNFMIDGGSSSKKNVGEYQILPTLRYFGVDELDGVFITHMDKDHVSGIEELLIMQSKGDGVKIKKLLVNSVVNKEKFNEIEKIADEIGIETIVLDAGDYIKTNDISIEVIAPDMEIVNDNDNENSMVLSLRFGDFDALFTGDMEGRGEDEMLEVLRSRNSDYELLKVGHHGSNNSTSNELLEVLDAKVGIISAGKNNSYGHPHVEVIKRLQQNNVQIYNTANSGAIVIETDGSSYAVSEFVE